VSGENPFSIAPTPWMSVGAVPAGVAATPVYSPGASLMTVFVADVAANASRIAHGDPAEPQPAAVLPVGDAYTIEAASAHVPASTSQTWLSQSLSTWHARQVPGPVSQWGVAPLHSALVVHDMEPGSRARPRQLLFGSLPGQ
jgi:hypothetical protein